MLINMNQMLEIAKENHFAVGAFNVADSNFLRVPRLKIVWRNPCGFESHHRHQNFQP